MSICMLNNLSCVWLLATLWTVAHQAPLCVGFSRQEYWSGLPCTPPGDLSNLGIKPTAVMSSALAGGFLPGAPPVQFSRSVVSDSLWPHESQHTRPSCLSPTPGVPSNSCPLSRWCHPAILSSVVSFSSCSKSLPASGFFPMSQLFTWGGQSIGMGFPGDAIIGKEPACQCRSKSHGSGRPPGEGNGNPLQYSCLGNPMDRGTWWATVHGVSKSQIGLSMQAPCESGTVFSENPVVKNRIPSLASKSWHFKREIGKYQ